MKNSFSAAKASALARQRQAKPAAESKSKAAESNKNVVVTAGESCSSSSLSLRLDSQVIQPYNYNETNGHFGIVEAATSSPLQSQVQALHLQGQGSVFQYLYPNSASLLILGRPPAQPQPAPAQPPAQTFSFSNETAAATAMQDPRTKQATAAAAASASATAMDRNRSDVDTTTASASTSSSGSSPIPISDRFVPVFDNHELMYLESIFGQDEQDVSHEEELSSILSLDRESKTVEVEGSNSKPM